MTRHMVSITPFPALDGDGARLLAHPQRKSTVPYGSALLELHLELQFTKQLPHVAIAFGCVEASEIAAEAHHGRIQEQVLLHFREAGGPDRQGGRCRGLETSFAAGADRYLGNLPTRVDHVDGRRQGLPCGSVTLRRTLATAGRGRRNVFGRKYTGLATATS